MIFSKKTFFNNFNTKYLAILKKNIIFVFENKNV